MKRIVAVEAFMVFAALCAQALTVYVSPKGNDGWTGLEETSDPAQNRGPLATFEGARARVRQLRANKVCGSKEIVEVVFAAGDYIITEPVEFGPEDSFATYRAKTPGAVTINGGRRLYKFEETYGGLWQSRIPQGLSFEQLYVDGTRVTRAKSPNQFYYFMRWPVKWGTDPVTGKADTDLSRRAFWGNPKDLQAFQGMSREALSNVVLRVYHAWETSQARLQSVDTKSGLVVGTDSTPWPYQNWKEYQQRYTVENFRAALDVPGEWFADPVTGLLSYLPREGERTASAQAVAPVAEKFMRIIGEPEKTVHDLTFDGLRFFYSAYRLPPNGQGNHQASINEPASIDVENARRIVFKNCEIAHTGSHALWMRENCRDSQIIHCNFHDLGGGAVYIGDFKWSEDEVKAGRLTGAITVDNNILQDGGWVHPGSIGLWIGHASNVSVTHNDISDFFYSGVSVGWTWGYAPTVTKHNVFAFNHIHHIGKGVLSDMGGIYMLGDQSGTVVTNNHIHDVYSYDYTGRGGWGLYTDEGSAGIVFENNLVHHVKTGCVHQHYGKGNVYRNNIFACSMNGQIQRSRLEDHTTIIVTNNIIWWDNSSAAVWRGHFSKDKISDMVFDRNVYWNPKGMADNAFQGRSWDGWRNEGQDVHSLRVDPEFGNPETGDFSLPSSSPAVRAGFKPFDYEAAGVYGDSSWRRLALRNHKPVLFAPVPDIPQIPGGLVTDFEDIPVGQRFPGFEYNVEGKGDSIFVTDKVARSGKRSLQVLDAPGLAQSFNPHFIGHCSFTNGVIMNKFSIRLDKGAYVYAQWRDYPQGAEYTTGPTVWFQDGQITATAADPENPDESKNFPLAHFAPDAWIDCVVRYTVSGADAGKWTIQIAQGTEPATLFDFRIAGLKKGETRPVKWIGFISNGKTADSFYVDDFSLRQL
jgi:hypothetical protein